jgi:hypothetical protein
MIMLITIVIGLNGNHTLFPRSIEYCRAPSAVQHKPSQTTSYDLSYATGATACGEARRGEVRRATASADVEEVSESNERRAVGGTASSVKGIASASASASRTESEERIYHVVVITWWLMTSRTLKTRAARNASAHAYATRYPSGLRIGTGPKLTPLRTSFHPAAVNAANAIHRPVRCTLA